MKRFLSVLVAVLLLTTLTTAYADTGLGVTLGVDDTGLYLNFSTSAAEESAAEPAGVEGAAAPVEGSYGLSAAVDESSADSSAVNVSTGVKELDGACLVVWEGSAVQNSGSSVIVARNSYIRGDTAAQTGPLEGNPGNLLVGGSIRTTLALGQGQSFYINSTIISRNWAALSTDGAEPALNEGEKELSLYAYGTDAVTQDGGYGAYSDLFCNLYAYGSRISAAEIGIISGTYGAVTVGTVADGENNAELSAYLTAEDKALRADKTVGSVIEGGRNAVMLHSVNLPPYWEYEGYSETESPLHSTAFYANASILRTDLSLDKNIVYDAPKQAYINHAAGSVILVKSTNVDMLLEGCALQADPAGTGYIIQTVYNNDTMFMNAVPDGETYPGLQIELRDMTVEGDVSHEDYQRDLYLTLSGTTLTGTVNEYDCDHWNACGAAEGFTDYCLDASYATHHGLHLTLTDGAVWNVTEGATLTTLTIGEGCTVNGALYVNGAAVEAAPGVYEGTVTLEPAA